MIRKKLDSLYNAGGYLAAFFLVTICLLVVVQVSFNCIDRLSTLITGTAIGLTIPSYADFTGFFLASASFLALAYTMRNGSHIRVTLIFSNLSAPIQNVVETLCLFFAASVSLYFTAYTGYLVYESFIYNDLSSGMIAIPIWIPQSSMLLGLALLSLSLVDDFFCHITGRTISYNRHLNEIAHNMSE